ncbi:MAG: hypothetical protein ACC641_01475 [Acidiferrobacterales bacterium]
MNPVIYYSLRSLSPYEGTIQVVETDGFRALSRDGETWRVRMRAGSGRRAVHGTWREHDGEQLEIEQTQPGFELLHNRPKTPFPRRDTVELWLLDAESLLPLALLRSLTPEQRPTRVTEAVWLAGFRDDESFYAPSLAAAGSLNPDDNVPIAHAEVLNRCVRAAAGTLPQAQWFRRSEDGGIGLDGLNLSVELQGRSLNTALFPELLVREVWPSNTHEELVCDYHHWQAPYLLTHSDLAKSTRERLELVACQQAERLYSVRNLLPEIINKERVDTAMVEAVIRRTVTAEPG